MITLKDAKQIAEQELERILANKTDAELDKLGKLEKLDYARESDKYWTFGSPSKKLQDEGYAPGAIMIYVDKFDGHIWGKENFDKLKPPFEKE